MTPKITPPAVLDKAGRALWLAIVQHCADDGMELDARERRYLLDACSQADQLERVELALAKADVMVIGSTGQPVPNGLLGEATRARAAIGSLLARLDIGDDAGAGRGSGSRTTSTAARHAALVRHHGDGIGA
jgi:hypothetical protein